MCILIIRDSACLASSPQYPGRACLAASPQFLGQACGDVSPQYPYHVKVGLGLNSSLVLGK